MRRAPRPGVGLLLALPPLILAVLGWRHRWMSEDAFIVLRVARNLLAGHGPVWNLDERVEIYTSPLWLGAVTLGGLVVPALRLEWIAVLAGLAGSALGLAAAERGALLLSRRDDQDVVALPLGALVIAALPPYWDYATSGLETGLLFAWLGGSFWALARLSTGAPAAAAGARRAPRGAWWTAVAIGLGPLVRPDLAIVTAGFIAALLALCRRGWWGGLSIAAAAAAAPLAYEGFRMGYFATLVPNTAIAKEAFGVYWSQGFRYLADFARTYWLVVPALALAPAWVVALARARRAGRTDAIALLAVPVACGLLHAFYVVRLGGDFMHARLLLPSLFCALLPVSVVAARRWRLLLPAAVVLVWALVCGLALRVPYANTIGPAGIADERGIHSAAVGNPHPVAIEDYDATYVTYDGRALRRLAETKRSLLLGEEIIAGRPAPDEMPLARRVSARIVAARPNVGLLGYAADGRVHVVDRLGLGDPLAARLRVEQRGRPGHEKWLSDAWTIARFADPAAPLPAGAPPAASVLAARRALDCPPLRELLDAVQAPLTPARVFRNAAAAWRLRSLSIASDPEQAAAELCS